MTKYDQARSDFELLETLAELTDQVELDAMRLELMQNPTRKKAAEMYTIAIRLWLAEHGESRPPEGMLYELQTIAKRYR